MIVQVHSLLGQTEGCKEGGYTVRLSPRALGCHKRWKSLFFCKIWNKPTPPLFFIRPLTNKHCRTWSSMINFGKIPGHIKSEESYCHQRKSLAIAYSLQKKILGGNMMLSLWQCFTWKFFMIWFHKILKLIFKMQPSCPRNICTEHWRKLLNLTAFLEIFLYFKNNDSVEHV